MHHFKFHPKCEIELGKLNKSVQDLFTKKFTQILNNPKIGKALGNKNNLNLIPFIKTNDTKSTNYCPF